VIIHATGNCFNDCAEFINELVNDYPREARRGRFSLVHGICVAPAAALCSNGLQPDELYAHAWIERRSLNGRETTVLTGGLVGGLHVWLHFGQAKYYADHRITDFTAYTIRQVWEQNCKHETLGPWEERYLALCRQRLEAAK